MKTIPQIVCGVIPPHILTRVAKRAGGRGEDARATLEHMREVATGRTQTLIDSTPAPSPEPEPPPRNERRVYDAGRKYHLPGRLVRSESLDSTDLEAGEAYEGSGATYDFFARLFRRHSLDGRGIPLDSTVHYGTR